jgi:hypothetical protein
LIFQILAFRFVSRGTPPAGSIAPSVEDDAPSPFGAPPTVAAVSRCSRPIAANGYRLAKWQGKPNPAFRRKGPSNLRFCDFVAMAIAPAFTSDSSRYLNCPSNLIGHGHPNEPANGEGNNGTFQTVDRGRAR